MKISELTNEQMIIVADNRPEFMAEYRPEYMMKRRPYYMMANQHVILSEYLNKKIPSEIADLLN